MKRLRKILLITTATFAIVLVALVSVDLGFLQGFIERKAGEALGRPIDIEGTLSIDPGRVTIIEIEGLAVGSPEGFSDDALLRIGRLYLELDTASLWSNTPPVAHELKLEDVQVHLLEDAEGRNNWTFGRGRAEPAQDRTGPPLRLQYARIDRLRLDLQRPSMAGILQVNIGFIEQTLNTDGLAAIALNGTVNDEPIDLEGAYGPWDRLPRGDNILVQAAGGIGLGRFDIDAHFDHLWSPQRPEVGLSVQSPSLRHVTETLALGEWGDGKVDLDLQTKPDNDLWSVRLQAQIGALHLDLNGRANSLREHEHLELSGSASGQNLGRLVALAGYPGWPEEAFELAVDARRNGADLTVDQLDVTIADAGLRLNGHVPKSPSIAGATLGLDIEGKRLEDFSAAAGIGELPAGPFAIRGQVGTAGNGETRFDLDVRTGNAEGMVEGTVSGIHQFDVTLDIEGPDLALIRRLNGLGRLPPGPFRIAGSVTGDPTGTRFDLDVSTTPGAGHIRGFLLRDDRLDLQLDLAGQRADRLGAVLGLEGFPETPWRLLLELAQPGAKVFQVRSLDFETGGVALSLAGMLGSDPQSSATQLDVRLHGNDASRLRGLLPETVRLQEEPFSLEGRVAGAGAGWILDRTRVVLGDSTVEATGRIGAAPGYLGTDLELSLAGADLDQRFTAPEPWRVPGGPFQSRASISIEDTGLRIEGFTLETRALRFQGSAEVPWPFDVSRGRVEIEAGGGDLSAIIPSLGRLDLADLPFSLQGTGGWGEGQFDIESLSLTAGEANLSIAGTLDLPPDASATDLTLGFQSPNLSRIGTLQGTRYGELPFQLDAHLTGNATHMEMTHLRARLGDGAVNGLFSVNLQEAVPRFDLRLAAEALNFRPFLSGGNGAADESKTPADDGRVIPDVALPLDGLHRVNGSFVIAADRLTLRRSVLHNSVLSGTLMNGELRISKLGTDTAGGRLTANLDLRPTGDGAADVVFSMHSKGLILDFSEAPDEQKAGKPPLDIDLDLEGRGATTRELAASLNGSFALYSPGGVISNDRLENNKRAPLAQIVNAVNPATLLYPETKIACLAAVGQVKNGVVQLAPGIALQSEWVNTFADGTIDLARERLDLDIESRSRKLVTVSAGELVSPFVKVGGTLAKPTIGIDPKGTLITGGAAVLSGGLSLLAQKALKQIGSEDPCGQILAKATSNAQ